MNQMKEQTLSTNKKLAVYLRELRLQEKHTMRSLAEIINTPHSFIGKIEQQGRRMDVGEFIAYCKALNKDPVIALQELIELEF